MVQQVYLPNGQVYTVTPVFGGFTFKSANLDLHHSAMPPGWTVVLQTEDEVETEPERRKSRISINHRVQDHDESPTKQIVTHRFTRPTIQSDSLFISSISQPASTDF